MAQLIEINRFNYTGTLIGTGTNTPLVSNAEGCYNSYDLLQEIVD